MFRFVILLLFFTSVLFLSCNEYSSSAKKELSVNPVIGDISYLEKNGILPTSESMESKRIKDHFEYVEQILRDKDVSNLSPELRANRAKMLDLLSEYRTRGIFPKNYDYPGERKPCFIDKYGRICAVGYLVEKSVGLSVAKAINEEYQYANLLAMNDNSINNWISNSGLTKEECAMIQPTYGYYNNDQAPNLPYAIFSSVLSGTNLALGTVNGHQVVKGADNMKYSITALVTGVGQLTIGSVFYPRKDYSNIEKANRNLSLVNIALGTSSLMLSTWNLISNRPKKNESVSWNIYSYPTTTSSVAFGFNFSKRF